MLIEWVNDTTLTELFSLALAFVLSASIGLERHRQANSAGLRTHTLVGLGAALYTLVSGFGFGAIMSDSVILDPSRIAAQVVSGIGFLGGGVIFVRQNAVNGLTTAASIWMVAAVGMSCGAGMPVLAIFGTVLHFVAVALLTHVARRVPTVVTGRRLSIVYKEGRGALRNILAQASSLGFDVALVSTRNVGTPKKRKVETLLDFNRGRVPMAELIAELQALEAVKTVGPPIDDD